jgi:hypothetical protein
VYEQFLHNDLVRVDHVLMMGWSSKWLYIQGITSQGVTLR